MPLELSTSQYIRPVTITVSANPGGPNPPPPPPPPPPNPFPCRRIATDQRGSLITLYAPPLIVGAAVNGETSGASGQFVSFAYQLVGTGGGDPLIWTYAVEEPDLSWVAEANTQIIFPSNSWTGVQNAINNACAANVTPEDGAYGIRVIVPAAMPNQMTPLTIGSKQRVQLVFQDAITLSYVLGDSAGSMINITNSHRVQILNFRINMTAANGRRQGIRMFECQHIDMQNCHINGATDGIKAEGSHNCHIRFLNSRSISNNDISSGDWGYGGYFANTSHLIIHQSELRTGTDSHEHALRLQDPTNVKVTNSVLSIEQGVPAGGSPTSKRVIWVYGGRNVQISNCSLRGNGIWLGAALSDGVTNLPTIGVRLDNLAIDSPQQTDGITIRCELGARDIAMREISCTNLAATPFNNVLKIEYRDGNPLGSDPPPFGSYSRDINWLPNTMLLDANPIDADDWVISSDWSAGELVSLNIQPLTFGSPEYQQYMILSSPSVASFISAELLILALASEPTAELRTRSAANGGVQQTAVNCSTGRAGGGEVISLTPGWPTGAVTAKEPDATLWQYDLLDSGFDAAFANSQLEGIPVIRITGDDSGAQSKFVTFLEGEGGGDLPKIVMVIAKGDDPLDFVPVELLLADDFDSAGLIVQLGEVLNAKRYDPG